MSKPLSLIEAVARARSAPADTPPVKYVLTAEQERVMRRRALEVAKNDKRRQTFRARVSRFMAACKRAGIDPWGFGTQKRSKQKEGETP